MTSPYRKPGDPQAAPRGQDPLPATVVTMPATPPPGGPNGFERSVNDKTGRLQALEKIGDILKREREKLGGDLQQIADYLRIRRVFLDALENSRYEEFPADAYVIGFLRSYAEHLGLNSKQAIDHYRREMAGRRRKPELAMPTPLSEGRAPSAIIMIGAAATALLIYIVWYTFLTSDRAAVVVPPPLPVTTVETGADTGVSPAAAAPAGTTPAASVSVAQTAPTANAITSAGAAVLSPNGTAPNTATGATTTDIVLPVASSAALKEVPLGGPAVTAKAAAVSQTPAVPAAAAKEDATAALNNAQIVAVSHSTVPAAPAVAESHLTITATENSWVQITDPKGHTLYDKIMEAGDTYRVPAVYGLKLTTGNGAGILLTNDGKVLPRLASNPGQIVRNVPLDSVAAKGNNSQDQDNKE